MLKTLIIGYCLPIMDGHLGGLDVNFYCHISRLEKCIDLNQLHIKFDRFEQFSSFAIWANVSEEVNQRLLRHGMSKLHPEDINSGNETWLIELCALGGALPKLLRRLRDECLRDVQQVTYFRFKNGKHITKRIARTDCTSFFRPSTQINQEESRFLESKEGEGLLHSASAVRDAAQTLGEVAMLARHIPEIGALPLFLALERLSRPGKLKQIRLYHDADGSLCGYVSWAWLETELAHQDVPLPHALAPHQWNEGPCLLVCDAFATGTGLASVCTDLAVGLHPGVTMHFRPDVPHGTKALATPMLSKNFANLPGNSSSTTPITDILAMLRMHVSNMTECAHD